MDDIERLFEEDVREKKIIARSARNKKSHSGCNLPSDFMSRKEVEQMNGEVKVINTNLYRPLTWKYFRMLSKEDQVEYIQYLLNAFCCTGKQIAEKFKLNPTYLAKYIREQLPDVKLPHGNKYSTDRLMAGAWEKFWAGEEEENTENASESHENATETTNSLSEGNEPVSQDAPESREKPLCGTKVFEAPGALVYSNDLIDLYYDGFGYHPLSRTSGEELDLAQMWSRGTEKQKAAAIDIAARVNTEDWKRPVVGTKDVTDLFNATAAAIEAVDNQKEDRRTLDEIVTDQPFETQTVNVTLRDIRDWNAVVRALSSFPLPLHNTVTISLHAVRGEE